MSGIRRPDSFLRICECLVRLPVKPAVGCELFSVLVLCSRSFATSAQRRRSRGRIPVCRLLCHAAALCYPPVLWAHASLVVGGVLRPRVLLALFCVGPLWRHSPVVLFTPFGLRLGPPLLPPGLGPRERLVCIILHALLDLLLLLLRLLASD